VLLLHTHLQGKTEFSQAKWLARKSKKYRPRLRLERVTAQTLCAVYTDKNEHKVAGLRLDTLALMLSAANVSWGKHALVFDTVMGVVATAVLERVGSAGQVLAPFYSKELNVDAVKKYNFRYCYCITVTGSICAVCMA
jgi:tRNA (adenine58-N1)-methyltransferase non-catalytic subunit